MRARPFPAPGSEAHWSFLFVIPLLGVYRSVGPSVCNVILVTASAYILREKKKCPILFYFHQEEAWNAYPYTKTRYTCPFVEKFSLEIETRYLGDKGNTENVFNLPSKDHKSRVVRPNFMAYHLGKIKSPSWIKK